MREKYWKDKWQANRVSVKIVLSDIEKYKVRSRRSSAEGFVEVKEN